MNGRLVFEVVSELRRKNEGWQSIIRIRWDMKFFLVGV